MECPHPQTRVVDYWHLADMLGAECCPLFGGKRTSEIRHQSLLVTDCVAKVGAVCGDDLCGASGIEVEGGVWPCSSLSRYFNRLCIGTFTHWIGWLVLIQGTGNSQGWWSGDLSCQFDQVLSRCGEQELVLRTARSTEPQAAKSEDPLEMGKGHLDFLAVSPGLFECRCAGQ